MMKMDLQHGKMSYWALIFSVAAHSVTLAVFTGVKLSGRTEGEVSPQPAFTLQMIEQVVAEPAPKPKPCVETIVRPEPKQPPLIADPEPLQPVAVEQPSEPIVSEVVAPLIEPEPDEVEFFGQKSRVHRVCYVVDCSGSMHGQMYQVKDQLKKSILKLNSQQAFSVVFFMEGQTVLATGQGALTLATATAKSKAIRLIESVRPAGSTDAEHALRYAMGLKDAESNRPQVVYFLTDGFDLDSRSSALFVKKIDRIRTSMLPGSLLHTIGFWPQPQDRQMLKQLAQNTGGEFIEVN